MLAKIKKITAYIILNLLAIVIMFLIVEGLSSSVIVVRKIMSNKPLAERLHTKYDKDLGWINIPNLYIKDMYGPDVYIKTNSQSFRNNQDFGGETPEGKMRIVCSGDSFTFGYGVDNDHAWCQLLVSHNPRIEAINMSQGGYGVDQAYLWFKRDSHTVNHDIHIFAFITDDFYRMENDTFLGYGKPFLSIENDILVTKNVPVPKRPYYLPWATDNLPIIKELNVLELAGKLLLKKKFTVTQSKVIHGEDNKKEIISAIFRDIKQINQGKNSIGVLLYLPTRYDYKKPLSQSWKQFLINEASINGLFFIDLTDEFSKLPALNIEDLFIPDGTISYSHAAGHYTEEGNRYIADTLYKKMIDISEISARLNKESYIERSE